ncbi:RNA-directed DNA polymerase [Oryzomonas sagensis]|uniref:RNA-directed DNA polymerase n=1 Tax=Oryzomonas sagensis TaxID=2603857 RepID=A0ABQ6TNG6_9BACT|nr:reverse transcriptase family protein [Oryzomonas sagensis]KAB0670095.1 RNA-directed DNA polymerase [Oryzomonas sagensis]
MNCRLPIQSVSELATLLGIPINELWRAARNTSKTYSRWSEPKPSGGLRNFSAPFPSLKAIQKKLHKLVFSKIETSTTSHYGIKGKSNITNACEHLGNPLIFTFDLKSFFPSIRPERVNRALIDELGCPADLASLLTKLATCDFQLPQGAPTSTDIANIVTIRLQRRLLGLARRWGLKFTIYADDVTVSGADIPERVVADVKMIVRSEGYRLHPTKGGVYNKSSSQMVTGINIAHGATVGKTRKIWRAELHRSKQRFAAGELSEEEWLRAQTRSNSQGIYANAVKRLTVKEGACPARKT